MTATSVRLSRPSCAIVAVPYGRQTTPILALKIIERERPIDLLLVDHAMPEMTGTAVIERAQTYQPGLKTLLISGHPDALRAAELSGVLALTKPFKVAELSKRIAEALAGS